MHILSWVKRNFLLLPFSCFVDFNHFICFNNLKHLACSMLFLSNRPTKKKKKEYIFMNPYFHNRWYTKRENYCTVKISTSPYSLYSLPFYSGCRLELWIYASTKNVVNIQACHDAIIRHTPEGDNNYAMRLRASQSIMTIYIIKVTKICSAVGIAQIHTHKQYMKQYIWFLSQIKQYIFYISPSSPYYFLSTIPLLLEKTMTFFDYHSLNF